MYILFLIETEKLIAGLTIAPCSSQMSPEDTHKSIRIYIGGLILGVNTLYMFFCFFKLFAVVGNELMLAICFAVCVYVHTCKY